ncbi:MAG: septation protein A [Gammaproteobacteria bacterium]
MKFLVDLFPVAAFFIAYYLPADRGQALYIATAVAIVASVIQVAGFWLLTRRMEKMYIATLVIILVLGTTTLLLQNKQFWYWKPTVVNWLFAAVFLASQVIGDKPLIERMLSKAATAPRQVWLRLNVAWVIFFMLMGMLNIYVAFNFAEHIWVNFKLFGIMGLTLLFVIGQAFYLLRYMNEPEEQGAEE